MNKLLLLLICALASAGAVAQPKIEVVGGTSRSFGTVFSGEKVTRMITLRNAGSEVLKIASVKASCGCTAALATAYEIAPNDTAQLKITFNSTGYQGSPTKSVFVESNDTSKPKVNISFTVHILTVLDVRPSFLIFADYTIDSPMTRTVHLKNTTGQVLRITKVTTSDSQITARLGTQELKPKEETDLTVVAVPKQPTYFQGKIELLTDYEKFPAVIVNFNAAEKKVPGK